MKLRIVEFSNGKYGIERRTLFQCLFGSNGEFLDFNNPVCWWDEDDRHIKDCMNGNLQEVERIYAHKKNFVKRRL